MYLERHLDAIQIPANLRINDQIRAYRQRCRAMGCHRPYHHFAFGQSPFSPPPPVVEALIANADKHDYLPTAGLPELREVIAHYYREVFGITCGAEKVVVSPGSKEMISMILAVVQGSLIIPTPSWVSYLPQANILKKEVISLRLQAKDQYKLTPDALLRGIGQAKEKQRILILNHPNNPTGAVYSREELEAVADVCRRNKVVVISDEIYARTSFDADAFVSTMQVYPEGTIVTGGMSKDRSSGGYRFGVGIFPQEPTELVRNILKIAGSTYSCVAEPIQYAALSAYSLDADVETYIRDCTALNAFVGRKTAALFNDLPGVHATTPGGAFYLFVDFNSYREGFADAGIASSTEFCEDLIKVEHVAMLPGDSLLLRDDDFAVRASFVDYDGDAVLDAWHDDPPTSPQEEASFFSKHCGLIIEGVSNLGRYLDQIREGKHPVHA